MSDHVPNDEDIDDGPCENAEPHEDHYWWDGTEYYCPGVRLPYMIWNCPTCSQVVSNPALLKGVDPMPEGREVR